MCSSPRHPIARPRPFAFRRALGSAVLLVLAAWPAGAQDRAVPPPGGAATISLEAEGAEVTNILQMLAGRSGLNIVAAPEAQGRLISLRLADTPIEEAIALVVRAAGLGYERAGRSILVAEPGRLAEPSGQSTRVFELQYADADDLRAMLAVITPGVTANGDHTRLLVRGSPAMIAEVASAVALLDVKPRQVLIEARIVEVNTTALHEIGIDWESITQWSGVVTDGPALPSASGQLPEELAYQVLDAKPDYHRQTAALKVALDALLTQGRARLLSNTKVLTQDGKAAEIFAGETVPVVITSLSSPSAGGVLQTIQLEKIDVGVRLNITPRIAADDLITVLVEPEVSRILAFVGPDNDLPQTSTRRARTLVRLRDGEKIYLGGLLAEEERRTVKKVPLLGDIPLLGYLFRHYRDETLRLDLLIEISPRIVEDHAALAPAAEPAQGD